MVGGEPAGDIEMRTSELVGATVSAAEVPSLIDELPLLALAACHARGETVVRGAGELRLKESDRIEGVVDELKRIGGHIRATRDGFRVRGVPTRLRGGIVESHGDHRLAMIGAVAGVSSQEGVELRGQDAVSVSFPGFFEVLGQLAPDALHYPPAT
jgi:3-phosphoshikimate 1-carboxyvinyltransferase